MSELNRREFLKVIGAAGAGAAIVSTVLPQVTFAQAPAPQAPNPEYIAGVTGAAFGKAVVLASAGPGDHLDWKNGDSIKYLPPANIPTNTKYSDAFAALGKTKILDLYKKMVTSRVWETTGKDLFMGGKEGLYGYFHMYIGEEAIATGAMATITDADYIASTHRGHGHLIAKGADLNKMSAEIYAKQEGYCKGYGLSMHITDMSKGILGMNGIVGAGWNLAAGAALAAQLNGKQQVAICFAGDGAANSRYFFPPLRNAKHWSLPYIAFIENNFQSAGTPGGLVNGVPYQSELAKGLGIPTFVVDGNDVAAVYSATKEAVDWARAGKGPSVVEAMTYRWYDHQGFAGAKFGQDGAFGLPYRSDDEIKAWMGRDPIPRFKTWILAKSLATADELTKVETDVKTAVTAAWDFGRKGTAVKPEQGLLNTWEKDAVDATQFLDRKGTATAWTVPDYLKNHAKNVMLDA